MPQASYHQVLWRYQLPSEIIIGTYQSQSKVNTNMAKCTHIRITLNAAQGWSQYHHAGVHSHPLSLNAAQGCPKKKHQMHAHLLLHRIIASR
jgi:hypothetical protein